MGGGTLSQIRHSDSLGTAGQGQSLFPRPEETLIQALHVPRTDVSGCKLTRYGNDTPPGKITAHGVCEVGAREGKAGERGRGRGVGAPSE